MKILIPGQTIIGTSHTVEGVPYTLRLVKGERTWVPGDSRGHPVRERFFDNTARRRYVVGGDVIDGTLSDAIRQAHKRQVQLYQAAVDFVASVDKARLAAIDAKARSEDKAPPSRTLYLDDAAPAYERVGSLHPQTDR